MMVEKVECFRPGLLEAMMLWGQVGIEVAEEVSLHEEYRRIAPRANSE